nr:hypothetical protein CFP56_48696 [Quercus suber]
MCAVLRRCIAVFCTAKLTARAIIRLAFNDDCSSSMGQLPKYHSWVRIKILLWYRAAKTGAISKVELDDSSVPDGSAGKPFAGRDVRLSEGEGGEILVDSPELFSKKGGYNISAFDRQREISSLKYVAQVIVVDVPDGDFGEGVGAAVCMKKHNDMEMPLASLTMGQLRQGLRCRLAELE